MIGIMKQRRDYLGDIRDHMVFYYTIPSCEESELYYGSGLGDTLYICIYPGESDSIFCFYAEFTWG